MKKKIKNTLLIIILIVIIGLIFFISRGPLVSAFLKNIVIPEIESACGKKVDLEKIYLNIFPLFIEARNVKVYSDDNEIFSTKKVKAYIKLSSILNRYISINRILIDEPKIKAEKKIIEEIIKNIQQYLKKEKKPKIKVKLKVIEILKGNADIKDDDLKIFVYLNDIKCEIIIRHHQKLQASIKKLIVEKADWPKIECYLKTSMSFKDNTIELKHLEIKSLGSSLVGEGSYSKDKGILKTQITLLVESVKHLLNLTQKGEGKIDAHGEIKFPGYDRLHGIKILENIFLDLKLNGNLYLQTLMEFLKVKEKIEGYVNFEGRIKGTLSDIYGDAKASLKKGNLFGVDINTLTCNISYGKGTMKFENGFASLYNGTAIAKASINLPVVNFFTLDVIFKSIDSNSAFELIGWNPEIPIGKVDGQVISSGKEFNPVGWFIYKSSQKVSKDSNIIHRIKEIKGEYSLNNKILSFSNLQISSPLSELYLNGKVDLQNKELGLKSNLITNNISELTYPYYKEISGRGSFLGEINGSFLNPKIIGKGSFLDIVLNNYSFNNVITDLSYEKTLLSINKSIFKSYDEEHTLTGKISFPKAKTLFDLSMPIYDLSCSIKNAKLEKLTKLFNTKLSTKGNIDADIIMNGTSDNLDISGKATIDKASLLNIPFDFASMSFRYFKKEILSKI